MSAASDIAEARAGRSDVRAAIARLSVYVRRNGRYYAIWAVITLAYVGCFVAIPIMVGRGVDAIGAQRGPELARQALWIGIVALLSGALRYFSRELVFNAGREVEYEIRNDLFAHLQRLPQSFYFGWRTGDIMSRCVNDLNSVRLMLGPGLLSVVQTPVMLVGVLIAMAFFDPLLTLLVVAPYFLFVFIARAFGRLMFRANIEVQEGLADLSNHLQETISGISVVKTYAMERVTAKRFARANQELFRRHMGLVRVNGAMPAIVGLLPALGMGLVLLVGGHKIAQGTLTKGEFMMFAVYIWNLTFPTFIMGWVFSLVQRGAASMQRIDEVLATEPSIADRDDLEDVDALRGEIEFRNLTFQYPGAEREPALRDVSLHVPAGSTLGVVGPVGSGKSTLASVIPRLYEVDDGSVLIDGVDLNRLPLATLRAGIAMVPQDSFLFSMSLADNVAFGLPETDPGRVALAVERAQLAKDLAELPHGLATLVGERGVMLSGGQRQRAALARALAMEPGILILDDTLSSVDAATEEAIQRELAEVFAGRTVLVISHRISSVRDCDQIIVLADGAISERGTHKELLLHGGFYARLARQQALEDALEEAVA
jgi:ATP-binding cassette subfamily B multidrug efflux pump